MKNITQSLKVIALALVLSFGISYVYAWTAPTQTPPLGNVAAPINTSGVTQYKVGAFGVEGLIRGYSNIQADTQIKSPKYCIGTSCITAWTQAGTVSSAITNLSAGTGITLSPNPITTTGTVSANTSVLQTRVTGTCAVGQAVTAINANGTVTCGSAGGGGGLGINQTWQDVLASRALNTIYQNNTGNPISVALQCNVGGGIGACTGYVSNVWVGTSYNFAGTSQSAMTFIVPSGASYRVAGNSVTQWSELR